jgi:hypothetical protein
MIMDGILVAQTTPRGADAVDYFEHRAIKTGWQGRIEA